MEFRELFHLRSYFHPSGWPIQFDYLSAWQVLVLIGLLAGPVVYLGLRALNWQSPARQAVSIGLRVAVVWVLVMTLAGARWQRPHRDLEVIAVRDVSMSIANVSPDSRGYSIQSSVDQALLRAGASPQKPASDKLGAVRFDSQATVDALNARVPLPPTVSRDAIMRLDRASLDQWWDTLGLNEASWWRMWKRPIS